MAENHPNRQRLSKHTQSDGPQHPKILGGESDQSRANPPRSPLQQMAIGTITLPSIQDRPEMYAPQLSWGGGNPSYAHSASSSNGYQPSPGGVPATSGSSYSPAGSGSAYPPPGGAPSPYSLPPVQPHAHDHRNSYPDSRAHGYYAAQAPGSYTAPNGLYEYPYHQERVLPGAYSTEYGRGGPGGPAVMPHGQSAPRQRTSIACKYCRRRKIRCSGYANSPGGKCTNCIKMNQECVFQPVSSTASTAFVPVSALPNGVPPGVPVFGAYGQPLAGPTNYTSGGSYQAGAQHYEQPLPSPTGSNNSYWEERQDSGRRRHRFSEDEHGVRLPPPNTFPDDNAPRRSPSTGSPSHLQPLQASQPQPIPHQRFDRRTSPSKGSPSGAAASSAPGSSVMNLENIMSSNSPGNDIDQHMLGRLNRRAK